MNFFPIPAKVMLHGRSSYQKERKKSTSRGGVHMVVNVYKSQPLVKFTSYFHYLRVKIWQGGINLGSLKI